MVADFLDTRQHWDMVKLRSVVPESIVHEIMMVRISRRLEEDALLWKGKGIEEVSLREVFKEFSKANTVEEYSQTTWVWNTNVSPRCKVWVWKLLHSALPTKLFLYRRGLSANLHCPRCHVKAEDDYHLILACRESRKVWDELQLSCTVVLKRNSMVDWWEMVRGDCWRGGPVRSRHRAIVIMVGWLIWKERNVAVFAPSTQRKTAKQIVSQAVFNYDEIVKQADKKDNEWKNAMHIKTGRWVKWEPPQPDWFKLNFDGGYKEQAEEGAASYVLRDGHGRMLTAGAMMVQCSSAFEAECCGLWLGLHQTAKRLAGAKLVVEGDAIDVISRLNNCGGNMTNPHLEMASLSAKSFAEIKFVGVIREANRCADALVRECFIKREDFELTSSYSVEFEELLRDDVCGKGVWRE